MANIYLTDLDVKAIVDFVNDNGELCKTRLMNTLRTRSGRNACRRG